MNNYIQYSCLNNFIRERNMGSGVVVKMSQNQVVLSPALEGKSGQLGDKGKFVIRASYRNIRQHDLLNWVHSNKIV